MPDPAASIPSNTNVSSLDQSVARPRSYDSAAFLPLIGTLLLTPVFLGLFDVRLWGIPLLHIYLFGVWFGLIVGSYWLSRRLYQYQLRQGSNRP